MFWLFNTVYHDTVKLIFSEMIIIPSKSHTITTLYTYTCTYIYIHMKSSFPKRDKRQKKKKMSLSCHFAVYWTYSLLHQCFMPNRYISLFKMYLTLLTSQRGALATDAKSCSLWRSLLERLPPAPETRVRDLLGVMLRTRGWFNNHCLTCSDWANRPF